MANSFKKYLKYKIGEITQTDKDFPSELKKIKNNPKRIFYRGKINLSKKRIGIVGSRRMSRYGREVVEQFVAEFVANEIATVSGFMYGVDTQVHQRTVEYGGKTIAVFGCGLDYVYPSENEKLYGEILEQGGTAFSEYKPAAKPHLWKFSQRNRIVAGLSNMGVLVIEAGINSGSLITARLAKEMGREVYAIPGPINSTVSRGTNYLIKEGLAKIVCDPRDILGDPPTVASLQSRRAGAGIPGDLNKLEKIIWEQLEIEALTTDEIAAQIGESVVEVMTALSIMSMKGYLTESGGKWYLGKM